MLCTLWLKSVPHVSELKRVYLVPMGLPCGSEVKASASNAGDPGSIPGWEDPLEKEMVTHSSILTWRIPWMEKPGSLQSTGSQRVGHEIHSKYF